MPKGPRMTANPLDFIGAQDAHASAGGTVAPVEARARSVLKTLRLPEDLVERLHDLAHAEGVGVSAAAAQALREYITRVEKRRGEPYPPRPKGARAVPSTL